MTTDEQIKQLEATVKDLEATVAGLSSRLELGCVQMGRLFRNTILDRFLFERSVTE